MKRVVIAALLACLCFPALVGPPQEACAAIPIPPIEPAPIVAPFTLDLNKVINTKSVVTVPVYRMKLTEDGTTWHSYGVTEDWREYMKEESWVDDGIAMWVSPVSLPGYLPLLKYTHFNVCWLTTVWPNDASENYFVSRGPIGYVLPWDTTTPAPPSRVRVYQQRRDSSDSRLVDFYFGPMSPLQSGYWMSGITSVAHSERTTVQSVTVFPFATGLTGGSTAAVKWQTSLWPGGYVELLFSTDNGENWTSIVKKENSLIYSWAVPNVSSAECRIMVRWSRAPAEDACAWAIGPKFSITKNTLIAPWRAPAPAIPLTRLTPAAPTGLMAAPSLIDPKVRLIWQDNSPNETGFSIERKIGAGAFAPLATAAVDSSTYVDTSVLAGNTYTYRVRAIGSGGASAYSNEASVEYKGPGSPSTPLEPRSAETLPPTPSNLQGTLSTGAPRSVMLTWNATNIPVFGFKIERRAAETWQVLGTVGGTTTSYLDQDLADITTGSVSYRLKSYTELVESLPSGEIMVNLPASGPSVPGEPEPLLPPPTYDGSQSGWAQAEITQAHQLGLTYPGVMTEFQRKITREEFCTIAVRLYEKLSGKAAVAGEDPFADTDNPDILKAFALGIVRGVSPTQFAPGNNITRQEMCVMIYRALLAAGENTLLLPGGEFPFGDTGEIAPWAMNEVRFCYQKQIMKGTSPTTISPLVNTPREQAIVLIYRTYQAFK